MIKKFFSVTDADTGSTWMLNIDQIVAVQQENGSDTISIYTTITKNSAIRINMKLKEFQFFLDPINDVPGQD